MQIILMLKSKLITKILIEFLLFLIKQIYFLYKFGRCIIKLFCIYIYMENNNINSLTFEHHDTYIYYVDELINSEQLVELTPTNPEETNTARYVSVEANLFTNGIKNGLIKFNDFTKIIKLNPNLIVTIVTSDGILMFNFATQRRSSGIIRTGIQIKTLATYKSGKYANYINVEIQIDTEDTYRIVTISY
jgi:hypothetical protein